MNRPFYSSVGKIKRMLVFSDGNITLTPAVPGAKYGNLQPIYELFRPLDTELEKQSIELCISFIYNTNGKVPDSIKDSRVHFFPTSSDLPVTNSWVQDKLVLAIKNDHVIVYTQGALKTPIPRAITVLSSSQLEDLKAQGLFDTYQRIDVPFDGGNILFGRQNNEDYMIAGPFNYCSLCPSVLSDYFSIPESRIFRLDAMDRRELLYHLDVYLTIVGQVESTFFFTQELLLYARAEGTILSKEINAGIGSSIKTFLQTATVPFTLMAIPLLVLEDENHLPYILPYNNCHVENYVENGKRTIRMYFPNYRINLRKRMEKFEILNQKNELLNFYSQLLNIHSPPPPFSIGVMPNRIQWETAINNYVDNAEQQLIKIAAFIGAEKPIFIEGFYERERDFRGSLHCMSLVVARDFTAP